MRVRGPRNGLRQIDALFLFQQLARGTYGPRAVGVILLAIQDDGTVVGYRRSRNVSELPVQESECS